MNIYKSNSKQSNFQTERRIEWHLGWGRTAFCMGRLCIITPALPSALFQDRRCYKVK